MQSIEQVFEETEAKSVQRTETICKCIIKELEKKFQIDFLVEEHYISYRSWIYQMLLYSSMISSLQTYLPTLLELLQHYQVNEMSLLSGIFNRISDPIISENKRIQFEAALKNLPYCKSLQKAGSFYKIEANFGTITFYRLREQIQNVEFLNLLDSKNWSSECHFTMSQFYPFFPDGDVTVSEVPALFGGYYYHSYFTLQREGLAFDIARNMILEESSLKLLYQPNELVKIPSSEFLDAVKQVRIKEPELEKNDYYFALQLALIEKRKRL